MAHKKGADGSLDEGEVVGLDPSLFGRADERAYAAILVSELRAEVDEYVAGLNAAAERTPSLAPLLFAQRDRLVAELRETLGLGR